MQLHPLRPALGCRQARGVLRAFLTAKLHRPLNRCTVPALQGKGCKLGHNWVCYAANVRQPLGSQVCTHFVFDRQGVLRRLTHIFFHETDHDHA